MNDWKERMKAEYAELKERLEKLHKWNVKQEVTYRTQTYCVVETIGDDQKLNLCDDQNRLLCREQEEAMTRYLHVLELRAGIYGIEL